ncbi:terminase large subunit domain-containing protein [Neisseriaceae bacterium B1]
MSFDLNPQSNVEPRIAARQLFWQGHRITDIARALGLKPATVYSWKTRDNWDGGTPMQRVAASAETRLHALINQPKKSDADYKEMKNLSALVLGYPRKNDRQPENRVPDFDDMPIPTIDRPPRERGERRERVRSNRKAAVNEFSPAQAEKLLQLFDEQLFDYQRHWFSMRHTRNRDILKSRQIGATFYFSRESLTDAVTTGKNKVFLSASQAQAFIFRNYMRLFSEQVDVDLKGADLIKLWNGAELHFLGTNSRTAQGRNGDLYVDEYFWIPDFKKLRNLANPMAAQKRYHITYFSTPSTTSHPAYDFWTGAEFNAGRPESEHIKLDVSPSALAAGRHDPDGKWRQVVTLDDAEKGGCNLFDREQLLLENAPAQFRQLFMCEFVDDGEGVFSWGDLQGCLKDSYVDWADFYKPFSPRPLGELPVWLSYDPADSGDAAALVVVLPPRFDGDAFRIVERHVLHGNDFEAQADFIRAATLRFNVKKVVVDKTGLGVAVEQLVAKFFPGVIGVLYTQPEKALMVNKMHDLLRKKRVEWETDHKDITSAFLSIKTAATASGRGLTYVSGRTRELSHSDVAWAALQCFYQEPLGGGLSSAGFVSVF